MSEERIDEIEQRLARLEQNLAAFQGTVVKKLSEALQLIRQHQKVRETRINQQLRKILEELEQIRGKLAQQVPPTMN